MPLTAARLTTLKGQKKAYRVNDEKGLFALVQPSGAIWWRFNFTLNGKRGIVSLGTYPSVSLKQARELRDRAREKVASGQHPKPESRSGPETFRSVARDWYESRRTGWGDKYARTVIRRLERDLFPYLGDTPIEQVSRADIMQALEVVQGRGAIYSAHRLRGFVSEIFGYALGQDLVSTDPSHAIKQGKLLKKMPRTRSHAALKASDMADFMGRLLNSDEEPDTIDALLLTIYTAVRTGETRFADFSEFEELDGREPLWRIRAERMKMGNEHLIPLPSQAADIVRRRRDALGPKGLLFPRPTKSGTISENTMIYAMYRLGYHSRATVHGLRGSFSTIANEAEWNRDWVEMQLAHADADSIRGTYNSAQYLSGRRELLQWWADWIDAQAEIGALVG